MENAGYNISKSLDFKFFWGSMPPDPPSGSRLQHLRAPPLILPLLRHCLSHNSSAKRTRQKAIYNSETYARKRIISGQRMASFKRISFAIVHIFGK